MRDEVPGSNVRWQLRSAATQILAIAVSACSRNEIDPAFVGRFELESRDGRALPAVLQFTQDWQQCTNEMRDEVPSSYNRGRAALLNR